MARVERALIHHPDDPALHYNLGTLAYRRRAYAKAAESLNHALASSSGPLQERASYNLGNTHYREGQAAEAADPGHAMRSYQQALADYRVAIHQNPRDHDAQYNYELTARRIESLQAAAAQQETQRNTQASQQQAPAQPQNGQQQSGTAESQPDQQAHADQQRQEQSAASSADAFHADDERAASAASSKESGDQRDQTPRAAGEQGAQASAQERAEAPDAEPMTQHPEPQDGTSASAAGTPDHPSEMSQQQALWILDHLQHDERGALATQQPGQGRESRVEQDW